MKYIQVIQVLSRLKIFHPIQLNRTKTTSNRALKIIYKVARRIEHSVLESTIETPVCRVPAML